MSSILHGNSPEVEDILNFFELGTKDLITKFSLKVDSNSVQYTYSCYADKSGVDVVDKSVLVPFSTEIYFSILNLLGLKHDGFVSLILNFNSPCEIAQLIIERELSADKIKKQEFTLGELIKRVTCANS